MGELTLEERGNLIVRACLEQTSTSPYQVFRDVARQDFVRMHGPEHHVLDGAALLTAYRNAGGSVDLPAALAELMSRGLQMPGAMCKPLGRVRSRGIRGSGAQHPGADGTPDQQRLVGQPHGLHVARAGRALAHWRAALLQARRVRVAPGGRRLRARPLWRQPAEG